MHRFITLCSLLVALCILMAPGNTSAGESGFALLKIKGMTCLGCEQSLTTALKGTEGVESVESISFTAKGACVKGSDLSAERLGPVIAALGYSLEGVEAVDVCPSDLSPKARKAPWADPEGLKAETISKGEKVKLKNHFAPSSYTFFDFGAPWCGPCHAAEVTIKTYLRAHDDTAVRAINLDATTAEGSFALPVAKQHLKWATAIPYFIVMDPQGKELYRGQELDAALGAINSHRGEGK